MNCPLPEHGVKHFIYVERHLLVANLLFLVLYIFSPQSRGLEALSAPGLQIEHDQVAQDIGLRHNNAIAFQDDLGGEQPPLASRREGYRGMSALGLSNELHTIIMCLPERFFRYSGIFFEKLQKK